MKIIRHFALVLAFCASFAMCFADFAEAKRFGGGRSFGSSSSMNRSYSSPKQSKTSPSTSTTSRSAASPSTSTKSPSTAPPSTAATNPSNTFGRQSQGTNTVTPQSTGMFSGMGGVISGVVVGSIIGSMIAGRNRSGFSDAYSAGATGGDSGSGLGGGTGVAKIADKIVAKAGGKVDSQVDSKVEAKAGGEVVANTDAKADAKPDSKADTKSDSKADGPSIILLGIAAYFIYRFFTRRKRAINAQRATAGAYGGQGYQAYNNTNNTQHYPYNNAQLSGAGGWDNLGSTPQAGPIEELRGPEIPAGFDSEDFLHGAKLVFTRLQQSWDRRDIDDVALFATPHVLEEIRSQAQEDPEPSITEILLINANILEVTEEDGQQQVMVFFDVLLREDPKQEVPINVREVWHFTRPVYGQSSAMWLLDGIQQVEQE